jgi:hypothetical protein
VELTFGVLLVVVLLALAGFFAWQQGLALRGLRRAPDLSPEDRRYTRNQAWRRLVCSGLMVLLAVMLGVWLFYLGKPLGELAALSDAARDRGQPMQLDPEQKRSATLYLYYWLFALMLLLALISLAAVDFFAIRRYGQRHYRQIQADRRAMIEQELVRLRSQRNGHE